MQEKLINEIVMWHKKTFPAATKKTQIQKLEEELNEYYSKYEEDELADVIICSVALWRRFDCRVGYGVYRYANSIILPSRMNDIVSRKMITNRKRKWKGVNGYYRHIDGSGEEKQS